MKDVTAFTKIVLKTTPVDFRKQAHGLSLIVQEVLGLVPFDSKSLYVFINKKRSSLRMLYWDATGFATWSKVLEKDKFKWPCHVIDLQVMVSPRQLKWLFEGVDMEEIIMHVPVEFERTF